MLNKSGGKIVMNNRNITISVIRLVAMVLIFMCHLVQISTNSRIRSLAIIFNVGVYIFIFLSGSLYGEKKMNLNRKEIVKWYYKRGIRILVPFYIFILCIFIILNIKSYKVEPIEYLLYFFNLQGLSAGVEGAYHLWFLTVIMICYIVTPLLYFLKKNDSKIQLICFIVTIQITCALILGGKLPRYILYVLLYTIGFFYGNQIKTYIKAKKYITFTFITMTCLAVRFLSKLLVDGTNIYDSIIVLYTQSIFCIWIIQTCEIIMRRNLNIINNENFRSTIIFLDSISYEFYITHMIFIFGPLKCINLTGIMIIDIIICLIITIISAYILKTLSQYISNTLLRKKSYVLCNNENSLIKKR